MCCLKGLSILRRVLDSGVRYITELHATLSHGVSIVLNRFDSQRNPRETCLETYSALPGVSIISFVYRLFFLGVLAIQSEAADLIVVDGQLAGAQRVVVPDVGMYDVVFVDGTCSELFAGCDDLSDFTFTTEAEARAVVRALFDQVLVDSELGQFDSDTRLTAGCESSTLCSVIFPFQFINDFGEYGLPDSDQLFVGGASNRSSLARFPDNYFQIPLAPVVPTRNSRVYAVFTPRSVSIPSTSPAIVTLTILGVAMIALRNLNHER